MNAKTLCGAIQKISDIITENRDFLVKLDQVNGDGDLGISMSDGFQASLEFLKGSEETDLGRLFLGMSGAFNEAAPSSLGTILSVGMMGMAKALNGKNEATIEELAQAMDRGLKSIMARSGAKPGEKTVVDALVPAVAALKENAPLGEKAAFETAAKQAAEGSEKTKEMVSVHGRAAYYAGKSLGVIDGGSVVGRLIFEAISSFAAGL